MKKFLVSLVFAFSSCLSVLILSASDDIIAPPNILLDSLTGSVATDSDSPSFSEISDSGVLNNSGAITSAGLLVSMGNISLITKDSAFLSGVIMDPITLAGTVYYGSGWFTSSGHLSGGSFAFSGLSADTDYSYRIGFFPFLWAGESLSNTGTFHTAAAAKLVPDIAFVFQQPSYVTDKNPLLQEFTCDTTKPNCSINFDLSPSFTGTFRSTDFNCSLDFWLASVTGQEAKCNPNTIILTGSLDYIVRFRIAKKTNPEIFSERVLVIHSGYTESQSSSRVLNNSGVLANTGILDNSWILANTGTLNNSWVLMSTGVLDNSWILNTTGSLISTGSALVIADPEIVIQSGLDSSLTCNKIDCIVNFEYIPKSSKEACLWSFSGGLYSTGTEQNCNPGYIHYPVGLFAVILKVYEQGNMENFREKTLGISNMTPSIPIETSTGAISTPPDSSVIPVSPISSWGGWASPSPLVISDPIIVVQSWLDANNFCKNTDCSLNLEYQILNPKEACHWDFTWGSYLSGTENKCNPGYIHYPLGSFSVTLRVYEQGNISNYREKILVFANGSITLINESKANPGNHLPHVEIKLQGTLGKTKTQQGNGVTCAEVDECSINLSAEGSYDLDNDKLTYYWNFGNGMTSDKENPPVVKYGTGEYSVLLQVTDAKGFSSEGNFLVSVLGKGKKEIIPLKTTDPNIASLKITGVSPNPLGTDGVSEWIEIANPLGVDISLWDCVLDNKMEKGSNPYIFDDSIILPANSRKRFYKLQTSLDFNNAADSANLSCDGKLVSTLTWDYSVPEGFIVWPHGEKIHARVLRVIDSDTIEVEFSGKIEKVHLIGVNIPEAVDPRKNIELFGKEAFDFTRSQLEKKEVDLEFDLALQDKNDWLSAYVWIDWVNFDTELIRLGYARSYLRFPFRYFKEFERIGKEAEKNKFGIWADKETKKLFDAEIREDKKTLQKQLEEEEKKSLDELMAETDITNMKNWEKLDQEILKSLFRFEGDAPSAKKVVTKKISSRSGMTRIETQLGDIEIDLQGKLSKNRIMQGWIFVCHTKKDCSVNLSAGKTQKGMVYFWEFPDGETFYGANPPTKKFSLGNYTVHLRVLDSETGDFRDTYFPVSVKKLVTVKKKKAPKAKRVSMKTKNPLVVREQGVFISKPKGIFTTSEAAVSWVLVLMVFLSGGYAILRRKIGETV